MKQLFFHMIYRKSSKETRGSYSFSEGPNAGLIRILPNFSIFAYCFLSSLRVLLECGSYSRADLFRGFTVIDCEKYRGKYFEERVRFSLGSFVVFSRGEFLVFWLQEAPLKM